MAIMVNSQIRPALGRFSSSSALLLAAGFFLCTSLLRADIPRGVFTLSGSDKPAQQTALDATNVDGLSLRVGWSTLEPTEGNFNFTFVDSEIARAAAAGKMVQLRIGTQAGKPQWVTDAVTRAGGKFFVFNDGVTDPIPVYWDPTYLAKKKALIAAVGAHLGNNPTLKIVTASFANATSEDWSVPHETADVAQWLALGYTSEKMLDAGKQIVDATMIAFPNAFVAMAIAGNGHVGNGLNLDPDAEYVSRNVIVTANASWPGRFIAQKNSLSTFNPISPGTKTNWEVIYDNQPQVAAQMLYWCSNEPTYRMNGGVPGDPGDVLHRAIDAGLSYGLRYLEIYQTDVINLPTEIAYAHSKLLALPNPTPTPAATPPKTPTGLKVLP